MSVRREYSTEIFRIDSEDVPFPHIDRFERVSKPFEHLRQLRQITILFILFASFQEKVKAEDGVLVVVTRRLSAPFEVALPSVLKPVDEQHSDEKSSQCR